MSHEMDKLEDLIGLLFSASSSRVLRFFLFSVRHKYVLYVYQINISFCYWLLLNCNFFLLFCFFFHFALFFAPVFPSRREPLVQLLWLEVVRLREQLTEAIFDGYALRVALYLFFSLLVCVLFVFLTRKD